MISLYFDWGGDDITFEPIFNSVNVNAACTFKSSRTDVIYFLEDKYLYTVYGNCYNKPVTITCISVDNPKVSAKVKITLLDGFMLRLKPDKATPKISLSAGKTVKLVPTKWLYLQYVGEKALTTKLKWTSSNKKVATVDSEGRVKTVGVGKTVITVLGVNKYYAKCTINVK